MGENLRCEAAADLRRRARTLFLAGDADRGEPTLRSGVRMAASLVRAADRPSRWF